MSSRSVHDPASYRFCESIPPEVSRRHWKHEPKAGSWHVISDGPDLMARLPRHAHFVTVLSYRLGEDSGGSHYQGPLYLSLMPPILPTPLAIFAAASNSLGWSTEAP
jgi:hypothetical protein